MYLSKITSFFGGVLLGLCFAPVFFLPGMFATSILLMQIKNAKTKIDAIKFGYIFGFGFLLSTLYWISFGVTVYIEQFWWAIPFALFGLPAFIAIFIAIVALCSWYFRDSYFFHFLFCVIWIFIEWVTTFIFTGFPWSLLGYSLSNILPLVQIADIFSILGVSFFVIYIGSSFYSNQRFDLYVRIIVSIIMILLSFTYGFLKMRDHSTEYLPISARIVQPSIPQIAKWDPKIFWQNLDQQINLSTQTSTNNIVPDLIIWSEAALTVPYNVKPVLNELIYALSNENQILITGSVSDNNKKEEEIEIYSSMVGLNKDSYHNFAVFEYHKSHLVPFGEYMPLRKIIPFKKITHGLVDYTPGKKESIYLQKFNLNILPLICYESIFPNEVIASNKNADIIINITNDAWYGNSSGPYQHFQISKMRTIENGLPMIRASNNGISAFIDPLGRVLKQTKLNDITIIDSFIPKKLSKETCFFKYGFSLMWGAIFLVLILQLLIKYIVFFVYN